MPRPPEYYFKEGCFIEEWHNDESDPTLSVARARVEVGQTTQLHALRGTTERYVMLEGRARVTVGEISTKVSQGNVVVIPAGVPQKIQNLGDQDLVFLAICTPRFEPDNYLQLESDEKQGSPKGWA